MHKTHKNKHRYSCILSIENTQLSVYNHTRKAGAALKKGSEDMDPMTTAELNQYLENIAKLIEATAKDTEAAAKIVRDSKVKA